MKTKRRLAILIIPAGILCFVIWAVIEIGLQNHQTELGHELIKAVQKRDAEKAILLLDSGANANATNKPYTNPTIQENMDKLWMKLRGIPLAPDTDVSETAITYVYPDDPADFPADHSYALKILESLIKHGAKIDATNVMEETALLHACEYDDLPAVKLLLQHRANPNVNCKKYFSPLYVARFECSKLLLQYGADVNYGDPHPLGFAVITREAPLIRLYLDHGANPNVTDHDGIPILHYVLLGGQETSTKSELYKVVQLLLQHGALVSIQDQSNHNALDIAIKNKSYYAIPLLKAALKKELASKDNHL